MYATCTQFYNHQAEMFRRAIRHTNFGIFGDMGIGKTRVLIALAINLAVTGNVRNVLVLCPRSVMQTWEDEIYKTVSNIHVVQLRGDANTRASLYNMPLVRVPTFYILNYEGLLIDKLFNALMRRAPQMIIFDESTKIKNPRAKRTRRSLQLAKKASFRYISTGTPITRSIQDVIGQFAVLDFGRTFPMSITRFRQYYMKQVSQWKWVPRRGAIASIKQKLFAKGIRFTKDECLDLPPKIYTTRWVDFDPIQKQVYDDVCTKLSTVFEDVTFNATRLSRLLRLCEITSGYIQSDENIRFFDPNPKLEALKDLLDEIDYERHKIIIWCWFVQNIHMVSGLLSDRNIDHVILYGKTSDPQYVINRFNKDDNCRVFIGQPAAGGMGINLTSAHYVIYYSNSFNMEIRKQSEDRSHRIGQKSPVVYIDLAIKNSVDQIILRNLARKEMLAEHILDDLRQHILNKE